MQVITVVKTVRLIVSQLNYSLWAPGASNSVFSVILPIPWHGRVRIRSGCPTEPSFLLIRVPVGHIWKFDLERSKKTLDFGVKFNFSKF